MAIRNFEKITVLSIGTGPTSFKRSLQGEEDS